MDISEFAIWKFRCIEGHLQDMNPVDVRKTKYVDPATSEVTWITYDLSRETATVERGGRKLECGFAELGEKLKDLGMYRERPAGARHSLAGPWNCK